MLAGRLGGGVPAPQARAGQSTGTARPAAAQGPAHQADTAPFQSDSSWASQACPLKPTCGLVSPAQTVSSWEDEGDQEGGEDYTSRAGCGGNGSLTGSVRPQPPAQGAPGQHSALSDPIQEEPRGSDARQVASLDRVQDEMPGSKLSKNQPILAQLDS